MIINQQQPPQFQPITITIETLVELEALRIAFGRISYNKVSENSLTPMQHWGVISNMYKQLKDL
jgi:hypothetical protein